MRKHGVDEATAERVFEMVRGFSGFGFPKAHGAAFGLLAYQSTWLRVHYSPEFLCSLLNEQPMGFYPPDALVHEAQRRGIEVLPPDVNESEAECDFDRGRRAVRIGLGYVRGVREQEVKELVAARQAGGRFRSLSDLASRAGAGAPSLELLAWSGACDSLVAGDRRVALWQLGSRHSRAATCPAAPSWRCRSTSRRRPSCASSRSGRRCSPTTPRPASPPATHPLALLRDRLPADAVTSRELASLCRTPRGSRWAAWSSPASGRGRPTASCSSCSRTSSGRST